MIGKYRIKKQVAGRGFFGEVKISVEASVSNKVIFETDVLGDDFRTAIRFGLDFGLRQVERLDVFQDNYLIRVLEINIFVVDSTPTILAFTAAKALYDAFSTDLPYPKLDKSNGDIIFKK